jgi:hypothetical protein
LTSSITGTPVVYGSGGGGAGMDASGLGGTHGGNAMTQVSAATSGAANTGGGGGAGTGSNAADGSSVGNGSGGSGVVVLRYVSGIEAQANTPYAIEGIQIGDPDATGRFTVTFAQTDGVLEVASDVVGGLAASAIAGNNSDSVTLTGSLAQINATLEASNGLVLTMDSDFSGSANLTMTTIDSQGASDTDVVAVTVPEAPYLAGQSVIDLGSYGKLIAPVEVGSDFYYYWDRSGNGTANAEDFVPSHDFLDSLFSYERDLVTPNPSADTTDVYRFASIKGLTLALPSLQEFQAIQAGANGLPSGWFEEYYWTATPGQQSAQHASYSPAGNVIHPDDPDSYSMAVAIRVINQAVL